MLTEQEIPTPGMLEYRRTGSTRRYHPGYECKWATNTVVHILENREYMGCLVNFKTEKPSYKTKHSIENPIEKRQFSRTTMNLSLTPRHGSVCRNYRKFMKLLIEQNEDGDKRQNAAEKRISELTAIFKRLYEDSVSGRISDECFTELSADYEAEQ